MLDILLEIFDEMHINFVELVTVLRINASYLLNGPAWTTKIKRPPGPVPRKMVNFNPSQLSKDFSSKNMQLEVTKYS